MTLKYREFKWNESPDWDSYIIAVKSKELQHALNVHLSCIDCLESLYKVFSALYGPRPKGGSTTDQQQDVLRSMLVFASAGVDGCVKHIIKGCIDKLCERSEDVRLGLLKYVSKKIVSKTENYIDLANALLADSPRSFLTKLYIDDLTGGSLQSVNSIKIAEEALGCDLTIDKGTLTHLKKCFDDRNEIIHELDYNEQRKSTSQRLRNQRRKTDILSYVDLLLSLNVNFILNVEEIIK